MLSLRRQTAGQKEGRTDGQTDRWTMVKQYAHDHSIWGHKYLRN